MNICCLYAKMPAFSGAKPLHPDFFRQTERAVAVNPLAISPQKKCILALQNLHPFTFLTGSDTITCNAFYSKGLALCICRQQALPSFFFLNCWLHHSCRLVFSVEWSAAVFQGTPSISNLFPRFSLLDCSSKPVPWALFHCESHPTSAEGLLL